MRPSVCLVGVLTSALLLVCLSRVPYCWSCLALVRFVLSIAFELCLSVYFLLAILRSSLALLLYSASYLRVLAAIVFPLSLCTQPPCFRDGRSVGDATPFLPDLRGGGQWYLWLLRPFQWGEFYLLGQSLVLVFLFLVLVSSTCLCSSFTVVTFS